MTVPSPEASEQSADAPLAIAEAVDPADLAECLRIRHVVFVMEQGVSLAEEADGLDRSCRHFIARRGPVALGVARLKAVDDAAKIQRVAVLPDARSGGVGRRLMQAIIAAVGAESPGRRVILDSQVSAIPFYERLGFEAEGPEFLDAGIPHRFMSRRA